MNAYNNVIKKRRKKKKDTHKKQNPKTAIDFQRNRFCMRYHAFQFDQKPLNVTRQSSRRSETPKLSKRERPIWKIYNKFFATDEQIKGKKLFKINETEK